MIKYPCIVVVAFNRPDCLKRLLHSIASSKYPAHQIPLVISIDKSDVSEVYDIAESFIWKFGEKKVIKYDVHQGLKEHIIRCGDLTQQFDSVIVLEDDLMVSPHFYEFALEAKNFFENDRDIAGISLYSYQYTENNFYPFVPLDDSSDIYFMQLPASWGQLFTSSQWGEFKQWWIDNSGKQPSENLPDYIKNWSITSWKKHFTDYMIANDKFFVYPRFSLSTDFSEEGTNAAHRGLFQVPMLCAPRKFMFTVLPHSGAIYDASFEILPGLIKKTNSGLARYSFEVDLYGTKPLAKIKSGFLLSSKHCSLPILSFGNELSGVVHNVVFGIKGDMFSLGKTDNFTEGIPERAKFHIQTNSISHILFPHLSDEKESGRLEKPKTNGVNFLSLISSHILHFTIRAKERYHKLLNLTKPDKTF